MSKFHNHRFPNESDEYRRARDRLLEQEIALRQQIEAVAAARRALPLGGEVPQDYLFDDGGPAASTAAPGRVKLSQLFVPGKPSLVLYSFMYGPQAQRPCPSCTSIIDSLDGAAPHLEQRINLAIVARSPLPRLRAFAAQRGWRHIRLLSSAASSYNLDYLAETAEGNQMPILNIFGREGAGTVHHRYASELLYAPCEDNQNQRHVDSLWPLWNVLDLTPQGRGQDWYPQLSFGG